MSLARLQIADLIQVVKLQKEAEQFGLSPRAGSDFSLEERAAGLEVLLSRNPPDEVQGPSGRIYHDTSIFCLRPANEPRRCAAGRAAPACARSLSCGSIAEAVRHWSRARAAQRRHLFCRVALV
jgi:hypothetical protein